MPSLAEAMPVEIKRVRALLDIYKSMRGQPNVMVEPAIALMEQSIDNAIDALARGEVLCILRAYDDLKGFEE